MKYKYWTISSIAVVAMSITLTATVHAAAPDAKQIASMEAKQFVLPDTIDMVRIPAGTFTMGSPKDELGRGADEPQRTVTISKPFYMAQFEIKQNQYIPLMRPEYKPILRGSGVHGRNLPELHQHGAWASDVVPGSQVMDAVQWIHAVEFCEKLTARETAAGRVPQGYEYRLPTEAEWEYACRAGTTGAFNNEQTEKSAKEGRTHKTSNKFGLANMHMGVLEWVLDDYAPYPTGAATDSTGSRQADPVSFVKGKNKVVRGGHDQFNDDPRPGNRNYSKPEDRLRYVRSASRGWLMPAWPYPKVGFRPVLAPKIEVPKPEIDPKYNMGVLTPYDSGLRKVDLVGFEPTEKE
ncbi:MAG: formylglycine-generating enzyme family protein [Verrucomicrobia bacterium]|nr:formylglycine-generating enzyme family protein [Verrucomicrobiota bacterium]MBT7701754.1 formylglycine-generating enzyme family protein [Verrucomicrobiota bacterium]